MTQQGCGLRGRTKGLILGISLRFMFPSAPAKPTQRSQTRRGRGGEEQHQTNTQTRTVGRRFLPHLCGQNVGFNRIPGQLIRVGNGEPPSSALLVQEGIRGLRALGARRRPVTLAGSPVNETPVLVPGRQRAVMQLLTKTLPCRRTAGGAQRKGRSPSHWGKAWLFQSQLFLKYIEVL